MDVKRKLTYIFWFCLPLLLLLNACDDMEEALHLIGHHR